MNSTDSNTIITNASIQISDVLCGRGTKYCNHPGNKRYHFLVKVNCDAYRLAKSKDEKTNISRKIIESLRKAAPPSRFLHSIGTKDREVKQVSSQHKDGIENKKDDQYQDVATKSDTMIETYWQDIGDRKAILKTSQLLREMVAKGDHKTVYQKRKWDKEIRSIETSCKKLRQMTGQPFPADVPSTVSLSGLTEQPPFTIRQQQNGPGFVSPSVSTNTSLSSNAPVSFRSNDQDAIMSMQQQQYASRLMLPSPMTATPQSLTSFPVPVRNGNLIFSFGNFPQDYPSVLNLALMNNQPALPSVNTLLLQQQNTIEALSRRGQFINTSFDNSNNNPQLNHAAYDPNCAGMMPHQANYHAIYQQNSFQSGMGTNELRLPLPFLNGSTGEWCNSNPSIHHGNKEHSQINGRLMTTSSVGIESHDHNNTVFPFSVRNQLLSANNICQDNVGGTVHRGKVLE